MNALPPVVVFCGPSITATEVREALTSALGADPGGSLITQPPVAQGGVIDAVLRFRPHTVVIVDGVFERVPAVWHKEVLWAMAQGIHVFGASSMGALRAAELHPFGMVGIGEVFALFRDGVLDDDDEVAVAHATADDEHRSLSAAMVDLRHLFGTVAVEEGILDRAEAEHLVTVAKALPYPQRAVPAVLRLADGIDPDRADQLRALARDRRNSRKHLDALECMTAVAAHLQTSDESRAAAGHEWILEPTIFLTNAIHEVERELAGLVDTASDPLPELVGTTEPVLRKQALLRVLAREQARVRGIRLAPGDVEGTVGNFVDRYDLRDDHVRQAWLDEHGLRWDDVVAALTDVALVDRVERAFRSDVDAGVAPLARLGAARRAREQH